MGSHMWTAPSAAILLALSVLGLSEESNVGQGTLVFNISGVPSFYYEVTASSTAGPHTFVGSLTAADQNDYAISGPSSVTVEAGAVTPDPTPEATTALLPIPNLDSLTAAQGRTTFTAPVGVGNDVEYTAASGDDAAKVVARVSPGAEAIFNINLDMRDPGTDQQVNFSLTDGENFDSRSRRPHSARRRLSSEKTSICRQVSTLSSSLLMSSKALLRIPGLLTLLCTS